MAQGRYWVGLVITILCISAGLAPVGAYAQNQPEFKITAADEKAAIHTELKVTIEGSKLNDLYAFELNLTYDESALQFVKEEYQSNIFAISPIKGTNTLKLAHTMIGNKTGASGVVKLTTLTFKVLKEKSTVIKLSNLLLVDSKLVSTKTTSSASVGINVSKTFKDLANVEWARTQIEFLASNGIINGVSDDEFKPSLKVTRADFMLLLTRVLELKGELGERFVDVPEGAYYDEALRIARGLGVAKGSGDNHYKPLDPITREDMMVLAIRALKSANGKVPQADASILASFKDVKEISGYAINDVAELVNTDLIHGYNNAIHPKDTTTRAEAAVLIYNLYLYLNQQGSSNS